MLSPIGLLASRRTYKQWSDDDDDEDDYDDDDDDDDDDEDDDDDDDDHHLHDTNTYPIRQSLPNDRNGHALNSKSTQSNQRTQKH